MKDFTQEEYEELIELVHEKFYNSVGYNSSKQKSVMEEIEANNKLLSKKIDLHSGGDRDDKDDMLNKAIALMNPYTRELVYDDLVEESKFVWQYSDGSVINKMEGDWYFDSSYDESSVIFTEKQIKDSPFDISKFKRIKVSDFNFN